MALYRQYCPVARATEIVADRWTPLILREMLAGCSNFNAIHRGLPGISRSLLVSRLRHLEDAGVLERHTGDNDRTTRYTLTDAGRELRSVVQALGEWGVRWAFGDPEPEELDPALLLWKMQQRINSAALPPARTTIEFEFVAKPMRRLWLVLKPDETSVCIKHPGFDSDLMVRTTPRDFYAVWLGETTWDAAVRCGALVMTGPRALVRDFPTWLLFSPLHARIRERSAQAGA